MTTNGRSRATRLAGEFLVIVSGVLTALAADSWVERNREASVVESYLGQLRLDTSENQELLATAIANQQVSSESIAAIRDARGRGGTLSVDSMGVLISQRRLLQPAPVQLVLGTVSAIVSSADINLVSDPQVRTAILNYVSRVDVYLSVLDELQRRQDAYATDLVIAWQTDTNFGSQGLPAWLAGREDVRTKEALAYLWLDGSNKLRVLRNLKEATDSLARALEAASV